MSEAETKVLASALYELRLLLGCAVGNDAPHELQLAWRLAYALHNEALAVIEGQGFDYDAALTRVEQIDKILGGTDGQGIAERMRRAISGSPPSD